MWLDDEATTMTSTSTSILSSNFPYQPPIDEVVYNRNTDILEEVVIDTGNSDQYHVNWDNYFLGGISSDARFQLSIIKAWINHYRIMEFITPLLMFKIISPTNYYDKHCFPASNEEISYKGYKYLKVVKVYGWLYIWIIIYLHHGYRVCDLFSVRDRNMLCTPNLPSPLLVE